MKKLLLISIVTLAFASNAFACCDGGDCAKKAASSSCAATTSLHTKGGSCSHTETANILAGIIDVQESLVKDMKDGAKKQELQKKLKEMEDSLSQLKAKHEKCCSDDHSMPGMQH